MPLFKIENRRTGSLIFSLECGSLKLCVEAAVKSKVSLDRASLNGASLDSIRDDLWAVLSASPKEVAGLRNSIVKGKIDGSTYEGECACLVGTLANERRCNYESIPGLKPNSSRPAEVWFFNIRTGDTPTTNKFSGMALQWIDEWLSNMQQAFSVPAA